MGQIFGTFITGLLLTICGSAALFVAGVLSNLPRLLIGLAMVFRSLLTVSLTVYRWGLGQLRIPANRMFSIDINSEGIRTGLCVAVSELLGWSILALIGWSISIWWFIAFFVHGLLVGLTWDQIEQPDTFRLGNQLHD